MSPLGYSLDLFFEKVTEDTATGSVRGFLLTAGNSALVLSPLVVGAILETRSLQFLYGLCFFVFCLFFLICLRMLEQFKDPHYASISFSGIRKAVRGSLGPVIASQFVLRIFFAWMAILLPLYLHQYLGFSWKDTGIILFFSLLPFILFEAPLGFLTDRYNIVRGTVFCGFLLLGTATALLALQSQPSMLLCISLLFISRIGASMVEIGTEAHFFRQVGAANEDAIMLFRATQPSGYLVGAALASVLLIFLSLPNLFVFFGCALSLGMFLSLYIRPAISPQTSALSCRQSSLRC
jgi:MFS family permease